MSDFRLTNYVAQHNNLIKAISKLDRTTLKVFEMAASCIDTVNPKQEVVLSKQDIFDFFGMTSENKYQRMNEAMVRLSQQGIIMQLPNDRREIINVTSRISWGTKDSDNEVMVKFSEDIIPYLVELKKNFTQYQITEIKDFKKKVSLVMFKWLIMEYNRRAEATVITEISMEELRLLTDTVNKYQSRFSRFEEKILKVAKEEINTCTSLNVDYEKIARSGKKISHIKWTISGKKNRKSTVVDELTATDQLQAILATFSVELDRPLNQAEKTMIKAWYGRYGYQALVKSLRAAAQVGTVSLRWIETWLKDNCSSLQNSNTDRQISIDDLMMEDIK